MRESLTWPRKIAIVGVSGAGKSTLGRQIAAATEIPYTEIDALYWGPAWTPRDSFVDDVALLIRTPAWVTEWQYSSVRPQIAAAAEVLVWLDLPPALVLFRVVRRTLRRRRRREVIWNGNVEPPLRTILTDREHIVVWAIRTMWKYPPLLREALAANPGLRLIRLRSRRDVARYLAHLSR